MEEKFLLWIQQISDVEEKRSSSLCSRLADDFENELLNFEAIPKSSLDFFLSLVSVEIFYNKPGIWNFIMAINNSRDGLSFDQYNLILKAFVENYDKYIDRDLCMAVCDFIGRNIISSKAISILEKMKNQEFQKIASLRGYAAEGIFIVSQEIKRGIANEK